MKKFEYQEVYRTLVRENQLIEELNDLGQEGWELISYHQDFAGVTLIMKREVSD